MMRNKRVNVCGVQIDNLTMQEAIREIERLIQEKTPSYVVTPNVDHVVIYQKDKGFRELYQNADLVLADGVPILWAAKFLGTPL
jgi:N-acetylglucosaminyldiphosphoundecaprenol N-acetyl-beta-D-mannosaminyltransferase